MKITKSQLKQIIKEELALVREEDGDWYGDEHETRADRKYADERKWREDVQQDFAIDTAKEVILDRSGGLMGVAGALQKQGIEASVDAPGVLLIKDDRGNTAWFISKPDNPNLEIEEGDVIEEIGAYVFGKA
tara:strand:+ start:396 stop:791 length:396 start_codon:yes stop_codon:yes gene_type:complete